MDTQINISHINKYFFPYKDKNRTSKNLFLRNKIVNYSDIVLNEVNICHKIKKIPNFSSYYSILEDYELLNLSELNENIIEKLKNVDQNEYYLFQYNDKNSIDLIDFIYNSKNIKKLIFDMINTFEHLLEGLIKLNQNNICFLNVSPKNIIFLNDYREKPVLKNFSYSINLKKSDYSNFNLILNKLDNFIYLPIEIHLLYHIFNDELNTVSYSFIEEFCEKFIQNLTFLRLFSENYRKIYKNKCIDTLKKYINKPKNEIIDNIFKKKYKWDVYSISILYIHIFGCISNIYLLKGTFLSKMVVELSKNLHPDPDMRFSLENTLNIFKNLLNDENDWKYVNNLDNHKLPELFDELSK